MPHPHNLTPHTQDLFIGNNKFLKSPCNYMEEEQRFDHSQIIKMLGSGDTGLHSSNKKKNKISSFFGSSGKKSGSPVYTSNFLDKLQEFQPQSPTFGPRKSSQRDAPPVVRRLTTTFSFTGSCRSARTDRQLACIRAQPHAQLAAAAGFCRGQLGRHLDP